MCDCVMKGTDFIILHSQMKKTCILYDTVIQYEPDPKSREIIGSLSTDYNKFLFRIRKPVHISKYTNRKIPVCNSCNLLGKSFIATKQKSMQLEKCSELVIKVKYSVGCV